MNHITDAVYRWQGFGGGFIGLLAAWIVAYSERRRDEDASAAILIADLTIFIEAIEQAKINAPSIDTHEGQITIVRNIARLRPDLLTMFDSALWRVTTVDEKLTSHLRLFKMFYSGIVQMLDRIAPIFTQHEHQSLFENQPLRNDAITIINGVESARKQAECATYLLNTLFLSKLSYWNRATITFRRKFFPTTEDKKSKEMLHPERTEKQDSKN